MAVYLLPGANQLKAAETIYATMERAKALFPPGMDYKIVYDTTPAVEASIHEILKTFVEALILVTLVVFIFLQNFRATIIPLITIPVSLIGTFIFFPVLGFSVNTLSMFGLVLAIGIVVDDAIVVVEAVIHHLEHGMTPREATIKAMEEVSAPVIGIALILSAVFVPVALLGGLVGSMYKQFALTIAISVLLSAFNALSLTPALCAMLLKPPRPMRGPLGVFFRGFNKVFDVTTTGYVGVSRLLVRRSILTIGIVAAVAVGAGLFARVIPAGFIPDEDQGIIGVNVQLPPGASLERTSAVLKKVEEILAKTDGIESFQTIGGYGAVTSTYQPNYGSIFARLKPWEERKGEALHVKGIMAGLQRQFAAIPEAIIFPFNIPTLSGFGAASGFNFLLQDRSGSMTVEQLGEQARKFLAAGRQRPELGTLFTSFDPNYPQVKVDLDREKARTLGVPVNEVFQAMSAALGGAYVNDFNRFGRLYRVYVQADAVDRLKAEDIGRIYVRSKTTNEMIPLSTLVTIKNIAGTELTTRFNLQRSVEIQGAPARGYTSGQALAALEQVFAETMPKEMGFAYSSVSYQEKMAPPAAPTFIMAIVCVFLLLAAMYESWRLPWAVLLGSPLVALGAFFGVWLMGYDNNVYVQIGLVMLIGLAAKNAILIVEFAKAKHEEGASLEDSALESARLRFRPILMTAFAFILGVVPLMLASGAGAGAQNVMGTGVFWGMLIATGLGVFIIPGNFTFFEGLGRRERAAAGAVADHAPPGAAPTPAEGRTDATVDRWPHDRTRPLGLRGGTRLPTARGRRSASLPGRHAGGRAGCPFVRRPGVVEGVPGRAAPGPGPDRPRAELRPAGRRDAHPPGPVPGRDRAVVPVPHGRSRRGRPLRPADGGKQDAQLRELLSPGGGQRGVGAGPVGPLPARHRGGPGRSAGHGGFPADRGADPDQRRGPRLLHAAGAGSGDGDLEADPGHPGGLPQIDESPRAGRGGDAAGRAPGRAAVLHRGGHHRGPGAEHRAAGEPDQHPRREYTPRPSPEGARSRSRPWSWPRPCRRA